MGVLKGPSPLRLAKAHTSLAHSSMSPLFSLLLLLLLRLSYFSYLFVFQSSAVLVCNCAKISGSAFAACLIFERDRQIWRRRRRKKRSSRTWMVCCCCFFSFPFSVAAQLLFFTREKYVEKEIEASLVLEVKKKKKGSLISTICRPNISSVKSYSFSRTSIVSFRDPRKGPE